MDIWRLRSDNSLVSIGYDFNRDLDNDSLVIYDNKGKSCYSYIDRDFDGIMDLEYILNPKGEVVAICDDSNRDGRYEDFLHFTQDSVITYRDSNQDGYFASEEIVDTRAR